MDYIFQMPLSYDDKNVCVWPNLRLTKPSFIHSLTYKITTQNYYACTQIVTKNFSFLDIKYCQRMC